MQTQQLQDSEFFPCRHIPDTDHKAWRVIRSDSRSRRIHRARCRRWSRIRAQAGRSMLLFGPLFVLVWLGISMLALRSHMLAGIVLLLILGAEAASVIMYLISDAMLHRMGAQR